MKYFHYFSVPVFISYSGGKEAMIEYYMKQARDASEEKDVVLYFDEAELGLMSNITGR